MLGVLSAFAGAVIDGDTVSLVERKYSHYCLPPRAGRGPRPGPGPCGRRKPRPGPRRAARPRHPGQRHPPSAAS